jgi:hypothetical protein
MTHISAAICTQDLFKVEEKQTYVSGGMVYFEKMRLLWQFYSSFRVHDPRAPGPPAIEALAVTEPNVRVVCACGGQPRIQTCVQKWQSAPYNFVVDRGMRAFLNDFAPLAEKEMYDRYAESPLLLLLLATPAVPTWNSIPLLQVIQGGAANGRLCRGVKKSEFLSVAFHSYFFQMKICVLEFVPRNFPEGSQSEHFVFL